MDRTARITLVATGLGLFMIFLDALIVNVGAAVDPGELQGRRGGIAMGGRRLQPRHGGVHHDRGNARRPARPQAVVRDRHRGVHAGVDRVRPRTFARRAERCARRAGHRGRDGQRHLACARQRRVSRSQGQGARDRHLDRDRERGHRGRPDARRLSWSSTGAGAASSSSTCRSASSSCSSTLRFVTESRDERPRTLDVVGQALFMVTVGALAYRRDRGPEGGLDLAPHRHAVRDRRDRLRDVHLRYERRHARPDDGPVAVSRYRLRAGHRDHLRGASSRSTACCC